MRNESELKANSKSMLAHLAETSRLLASNEIGVDKAKAQATLVKQANNLLRYELDRAKAIASTDDLAIRDIEEY